MRLEPVKRRDEPVRAARAGATRAARRRRHRHGRARGRRGGAAPPPRRAVEDRHARRGARPGLQPRPALQAPRPHRRAGRARAAPAVVVREAQGRPARRLQRRARSTSTARVVVDEAGGSHPYDALVIATGSRAFVPPIPGADLPHVDVFRTWRDADALAATPPGTRAVVVGGGLLGLEAAAGLHARGVAVTVVELAGHLMNLQLDAGAASMLRRDLERQGIACRVGRSAARIESGRVVLDDGTELPCERVVVAAGVRAETSLARAAGPADARAASSSTTSCARAPRTCGRSASAPSTAASSTACGRRSPTRRAWPARCIAGDPAAFHGAVQATTLKVSGVDVYAGGASAAAAPPGHDEIVFSRHAPRDLPPARARRRPARRGRPRGRRERGAQAVRAAAPRRRRAVRAARRAAARRPRRCPTTRRRPSARATPLRSARSRPRSAAAACTRSLRSAS